MKTFTMLKYSARLFAAVLAVASFSQLSNAQTADREVKVDVPFNFEYATGRLPAGMYTIDIQNNGITRLESKSKSGLMMTQGQADRNASGTSKLVFRRYGDQYFLREIWTEGSSSHLSIAKSKAEEKAEKAARTENAANRADPVGVEIAIAEVPR